MLQKNNIHKEPSPSLSQTKGFLSLGREMMPHETNENTFKKSQMPLYSVNNSTAVS